jgi:hypothetical protein
MFRTFAMVSIAVICMAPGALIDAAMAIEAAQGDSTAVESHAGNTQSAPMAEPRSQGTWDAGCVGFHGTGSGHLVNGRCAAR